jgi:hypothetical protein
LVFPYVQGMTQPSGTNLCGYYVCDFMHRLTACADGGKFEEKLRAHTIETTSSSYCSYSPIEFLFYCSYSLVDFQHQRNIPRDWTNPIDTRTSKYVREKKNKKQKNNHLSRVVPCHVGWWRAHLYRAEAPPGANVRHLYRVFRPVQMLDHICTGSIPGTNEGFEPVQKAIFSNSREVRWSWR